MKNVKEFNPKKINSIKKSSKSSLSAAPKKPLLTKFSFKYSVLTNQDCHCGALFESDIFDQRVNAIFRIGSNIFDQIE